MLGKKHVKRLMESPRLIAGLGVAAVLAYIVWIGGPYLRSIIVRDAAVTTWINIVRAPIDGYLDAHPLRPGARVEHDGRIASMDNPLTDATAPGRGTCRARCRHRPSGEPEGAGRAARAGGQ